MNNNANNNQNELGMAMSQTNSNSAVMEEIKATLKFLKKDAVFSQILALCKRNN